MLMFFSPDHWRHTDEFFLADSTSSRLKAVLLLNFFFFQMVDDTPGLMSAFLVM